MTKKKSKTNTEEIPHNLIKKGWNSKKKNKRNSKHWKNGREKQNDTN